MALRQETIREIEPLLRYSGLERGLESYLSRRNTEDDLTSLYKTLGDFVADDEDTLMGASDSGITGSVNHKISELEGHANQNTEQYGEEILEDYVRTMNNRINEVANNLRFEDNVSEEDRQVITKRNLYNLIGNMLYNLPKSENYNNQEVNEAIDRIKNYENLQKNNDHEGLKRQVVREKGLPDYVAGFPVASKWSSPENVRGTMGISFSRIGVNFLNEDNTLNVDELRNYIQGNVKAYGRIASQLRPEQ